MMMKMKAPLRSQLSPGILSKGSLIVLMLVSAGCVTTSQSKSEYQAEVQSLQAELNTIKAISEASKVARDAIREQYELLFMEWQRSEGRRSHRPVGSP